MRLRMKNRIEIKKVIVLGVSIIVIASIIFSVCLVYQYKEYMDNFNKKIGAIVTSVENEYPSIDKNELFKILNSNEDIDISVFEEYGIDVNEDSIILKNDKMFAKSLFANICFLIVTAIVVMIIFVKYDNAKNKKIEQITRYIEQINNKNYKLDIEDNTEGELSILKNEIYKTTVMLKEVAENSVNDKISLKDSLTNISHQLRTPLASISVMIDNIIDNPDMDCKTRNEFIKDIRREIININFLVESLLKLSKLDANSVQFIKKQVDVKMIVNEAVKNVSVLCDLKNIKILVNENCNAKVNCDFKWQVEAVTNIIKNCVEHSNNNSKIEITFEENNIYTKIEIKDYGTGIDSNDLPHIFERFYKGKNSSNESVGIGLALAKSIIERDNNGYIDVMSDEKNGTMFTIKYFKE